MMDVDALILSVFKRPAIWKKGSKHYSTRKMVEKYWRDISKELNVEEILLRRKWKYLRDNFAVEYGKHATQLDNVGDDVTTYCHTSKWQFFEKLLFLKDVITPRPLPGSTTGLNLRTFIALDDDGGGGCGGGGGDDDGDCDGEDDGGGGETLNRWSSKGQGVLTKQEAFPMESYEPEVASPSSQGPSPLTNEKVQNGMLVRLLKQKRQRETKDEDFEPARQTPPTSTNMNLNTNTNTKRQRHAKEFYYNNKDFIDKEETETPQCLCDKSTDSRRLLESDGEDLMFFKSLMPHITLIPRHMKLRFRNRIQCVVEEFAYPPLLGVSASPTSQAQHDLKDAFDSFTAQTTPADVGSVVT